MGLKSRLLVAAGVVVGGIGLMTPAASAGQPAVTGCYGESISALASNQPAPGAFGAVSSASPRRQTVSRVSGRAYRRFRRVPSPTTWFPTPATADARPAARSFVDPPLTDRPAPRVHLHRP